MFWHLRLPSSAKSLRDGKKKGKRAIQSVYITYITAKRKIVVYSHSHDFLTIDNLRLRPSVLRWSFLWLWINSCFALDCGLENKLRSTWVNGRCAFRQKLSGPSAFRSYIANCLFLYLPRFWFRSVCFSLLPPSLPFFLSSLSLGKC